MVKKILNRLGYYKLDQLTHWGHCGCCGKSINGILDANWNWGICDECNNDKSKAIKDVSEPLMSLDDMIGIRDNLILAEQLLQCKKSI